MLVLAVGAMLLAGCATGGAYQEGTLKWRSPMGQFPWSPASQSPVSAIGMSSMPADPVRRSSTEIRSLNGDYTYSHSQGTDNSASRSFDSDTGLPREDWRQSTFNNTYESFRPNTFRFHAPVVNDYSRNAPQPGCIQGTIRAVPFQKSK